MVTSSYGRKKPKYKCDKKEIETDWLINGSSSCFNLTANKIEQFRKRQHIL